MTHRASLVERIAWTTAISPVDAKVLQALATFAHFETGQNAHPGLDRLIARTGLSERTIFRSLRALADEGWIRARRRHRHATVYDICVDRLATNYVGAKVIARADRSDCQVGSQPFENLTAKSGDLTAKSGFFDCQVGSPIRSTYPCSDPLSAPAGAGASATNDEITTITTTDEEAKVDAIESAVADPDLRADGGDYPDAAGTGSPGPGRDQTPAPGAGVPLRPGPDSSRAPGPDRPRAPADPQQQSFGPLDVSPPPVRQPRWGDMAAAIRRGLETTKDRKAGNG